MKKLFLTLTFILTSLSTAVMAEEHPLRPLPPADCEVKNPHLVNVRLHGAYVISVSTTLNCHNKNDEKKLAAGQSLEWWVAPGATINIEAYTGVGSNTKNLLNRTIGDDYQIDCGFTIADARCDYHKGPAEGQLQSTHKEQPKSKP